MPPEKCAKLSTGPTEPIAGPTLPREVATAPMEVLKSIPVPTKIVLPTKNMLMYTRRNTKIFTKTRDRTTVPFSRRGMTARGCKIRLNSR